MKNSDTGAQLGQLNIFESFWKIFINVKLVLDVHQANWEKYQK